MEQTRAGGALLGYHLKGESVVAKIPRASFCAFMVPLGVEALVEGSVCITQAQTYFTGAETGGLLVSLPHGNLERIRKVQGKEKTNVPYIIEVSCKDLRAIRFVLPGKLQYKQMVSVLEALAYELEMSQLFAFRWGGADTSYGQWRYNAEQEYTRCGLHQGDYRLTSLNAHYGICDSYPQLLAVPAQATDDILRGVAAFRSRGRMPVATYKFSDSGAALYRCSQPLVGLKNQKCPEDEQLLAIMAGLPLTQKVGRLAIMDARPKVAAVGNKFLGAGMEHVGPGSRYEGCSLEYLNIGNIHTMRGALQKLVEALEIADPRKQEQAIERSDWKEHLTRILAGAARISSVLQSGSPVLVHCLEEREMQLLTNHGFCKLEELLKLHYDPESFLLHPDSDLLVASYEPMSDSLRYVRCHSLIVNSARRQTLVEFTSSKKKKDAVSVLVSEDHDMWVSDAQDSQAHFVKRRASELMDGGFRNSGGLRFKTTPKGGAGLATLDESSRSKKFEKKLLEWHQEQQQQERLGAVMDHLPDWMFQCSQVEALVILQRLSLGLPTLRLACSQVRLRDDLVRLALHAGRSPHCRLEECGWIVELSDCNEPVLEEGEDIITRLPYEGRTWCVTVPSGLIVVRRVNEQETCVSRPVVVGQCTDGWDRTAQLTCLTQMMLDPYYRTLEGFAVLVEKEWLSFGHKFAQRHGHGTFSPKWKDTQRAPIFLQFLDCCWQLLQQYPTSFEWNERHLIFLVDSCYSTLFGTFLCNTDQERRVLYKVYDGTVSVWAFIIAHREHFVNPLYEMSDTILSPKVSGMQVWRALYCRFQWGSVNELAGQHLPSEPGAFPLSCVTFNSAPRSLRVSNSSSVQVLTAAALTSAAAEVRHVPAATLSSPGKVVPVKERLMTRQGRSDSVTMDDIDGARRRRVSWEAVTDDNESLSVVPELSDEEDASQASSVPRSLVMESYAEPHLASELEQPSEVLDWNVLQEDDAHQQQHHHQNHQQGGERNHQREPQFANHEHLAAALEARAMSPRTNAAKRRGVKLDPTALLQMQQNEME